jgi:hypothetical protein
MYATPPPTLAVGPAEGQRRRAPGMTVTAERRRRLIGYCQLTLLEASRSCPGRTASTDKATADLWRQFRGSGK